MSDFRAVAHLEEQLGEQCWRELIDSANTGKIKRFLDSIRPLLIPVGVVDVLTVANFDLGNFFKVNTEKNAPVKISYISESFKKLVLQSSASGEKITLGVISSPTRVRLRYHTLNKPSADAPIIAQLGGEDEAATSRFELAACMWKQGGGEPGDLLTNGCWNKFYVPDVTGGGPLRAVYVRWYSVGWDVDANSVGYPDGWAAGGRVFSRDSYA